MVPFYFKNHKENQNDKKNDHDIKHLYWRKPYKTIDGIISSDDVAISFNACTYHDKYKSI